VIAITSYAQQPNLIYIMSDYHDAGTIKSFNYFGINAISLATIPEIGRMESYK